VNHFPHTVNDNN